MADPTILHLTDLHFGWDEDAAKKAARQLVLDGMIEHIAQLPKEWRPQLICISGDIAWKGRADEYALAKAWLTKLLARLGLGFESVVVGAGNHDVDRGVTGRMGRPSDAAEADDILRAPIAPHNLTAFAAFTDFCKDSGITPYTFQGQPSYLLGSTVLDGVRFVACNSAWFCKDNYDKGKLWLGLPLIRLIEAEGGLKTSGGEPTVCLIHHPPDWWHEAETNATTGRPNTRDYLAHRTDLILTGHTHGEVRKADRIAQGALHLTGGAGYSGPDHYNSYRLIRIGKKSLQWRSFEYDPRSADSAWRDHGEHTVPFVEGPSETSQVALAQLSIDIGVLRDPPTHIDPSDKFTDDRVLRYTITKEKDDERVTVISPQMGYLSQMGKVPLEAISFFWNPFKCDYPSLDVTFVNNTGGTLAVTEAVFEVAESVPDITPVIVFKDDNARMKLVIHNEGWGKVCNAVIRCNILPTGETERRPDPPIGHIPVSEPYLHQFELPDFEEAATLDLDETLAKFGVKLEAIRQAGFVGQAPMVAHAMQHGLDKELSQHYGRFPALDTDEAWAPFPDGYAVVAGTLNYNDEAGGAYSVPFRVRVFLFQTKYRLPMPPSYTYNVMLEPEGKKYEVACSVVHSLQNGEADRIHIRVGCPRSATHTFRIKWRLSGGRELVSGPITLRHFVPRRWANRRRKQAEIGQEEAVQLPPPTERVGCVEASIRTALEMQAAVAQARRNAAQQTVGYFAYGSNMYLPRLHKRAKSAVFVAKLGIRGFVMKFNKVGEDGSAKCNIVHTGKDEDTVVGVIFELAVEDLANLDQAEKGYMRTELTVTGPKGPVTLLTYIATGANTAEDIQPFAWYKNYVLEGAKMFKLPQEYIDSVIVPVEVKEGPEPADFE